VERQLFKHQVGLSANSISGRYVDFSDNYYRLTELRKQSSSSKQGSDGILDRTDLQDKIEKHVKLSAELYRELCSSGVAKEQARAVLPMLLETQFIWTGSLLAFIHMWKLRLKSDTQKETRDIAANMLDLVKSIEGNPFKATLEAFKL
jgi:thymidylate synthase (FAD)